MRIPVLRAMNEMVRQEGEESILKTIGILERISQIRGLREEEIEVLGELISNLLGGVEVEYMIRSGKSQSEALNSFMKRVLGSIDTKQEE